MHTYLLTQNTDTRKKVLFPAFALLLFSSCCACFAISILFPTKSMYAQTTNFSQDWTCSEHNGTVSLPTWVNSPASGAVTLYKQLPQVLNSYENIAFYTTYCDVDIWVDNTLLYHYDTHSLDPVSKGSMGKWHFVPLPYGAEHQRISIVYTSPYTANPIPLYEVFMGTQSALTSHILFSHLSQYLMGISLLTFGAIFFFVTAIIYHWTDVYYEIGCIALLSVLVGSWMQCACAMPSQLVLSDRYLLYLLSHALRSLAPFPFLLYLRRRLNQKEAVLIDLLLATFGLYFIISHFIQFVGVTDFAELAPVFVGLLWLTILVCLYLILHPKTYPMTTCERSGHVLLLLAVAYVLISSTIAPTTTMGFPFQIGCFLSVILLSSDGVNKVLHDVQQTAKLKEQLREKQEYISASQMKPHFIYNTLGAIKTMIYTDPDMAYRTMGTFSRYLRSVIGNQAHERLIPFSRELDHIQTYCEIEKYRYQSRMNMECTIETKDFMVPPISIQPIVENAIKHGIFPKEEGGTVRLSVFNQVHFVEIVVEDDGVGFMVDTDRPNSVGLSNISFRLKTLLNAQLTVESTLGVGTSVRVKIPKKGTSK